MANPALILPLILVGGVAVIVLALAFASRRQGPDRAPAHGTAGDASATSFFDGGASADCGAGGDGGGCD